jgi:enoyl-CoA hydratase
MAEFNHLKLHISDKIATLTLSRPEVMNALCHDLIEEINTAVDTVMDNESKVLIITGEGKSFAAGADIAEIVSLKEEEARRRVSRVQHIFNRFAQLPIPVIAALNGYTIGGGLELALSCDIRIASDKAQFSMPEANLGVVPGGTGTQRLSRIIGLGNALHWFFTCDKFNADDALRLRLVQQVVNHDELMDTAMLMAKKILTKSPEAISMIKEVTRTGIEMDFYKGCEAEAKMFAKSLVGCGQEGLNAFLEKRKPNWNN